MNSLQRESIARRYVEIRNSQDGSEHGPWWNHLEMVDILNAWLESFGLMTSVPSQVVVDYGLEVAQGAALDALANIPQRPAGMTDVELREHIRNLWLGKVHMQFTDIISPGTDAWENWPCSGGWPE